MLSPLAKQECLTIAAIGALLCVAALVLGAWWLVPVVLIATVAVLAFFRDPDRRTPTQRGVMVAPSHGRVSSVHEVEHFAPLDGPATCVRIFMSVFDVHINYSPYHATVSSITHTDGAHLNTLNPQSAEDNESNLVVLRHPTRGYPVAAVRQVAGLVARTIVCSANEEEVLQRGQRIGLIKLGSTTELYIAHDMQPQVTVGQGQKVVGGVTVLAQVTPKEGAAITARPEREEAASTVNDGPAPEEDVEPEDDVETVDDDVVEEDPVGVEG